MSNSTFYLRQREAKAAIEESARHARLLTRVGMRVSLKRDNGTSLKTLTASEPWQLGHGAWVVKLLGLAGGYDCARVTPLESEVPA